MRASMECVKCGYVGTYSLTERQAADIAILAFECGNCGFTDNGFAYRHVSMGPRTLKQILLTTKIIVREIGKSYKDIGSDFRYTLAYEPERITNFAGWMAGCGIFIYTAVPVMTGLVSDAQYVAGRQEILNLLIGIASLGFSLYMLRKRWD
jgi:hypothetical protein